VDEKNSLCRNRPKSIHDFAGDICTTYIWYRALALTTVLRYNCLLHAAVEMMPCWRMLLFYRYGLQVSHLSVQSPVECWRQREEALVFTHSLTEQQRAACTSSVYLFIRILARSTDAAGDLLYRLRSSSGGESWFCGGAKSRLLQRWRDSRGIRKRCLLNGFTTSGQHDGR